MHLKHEREQAGASAKSRAAQRGATAAVNASHRPVAGQLLVRWELQPDTSILWLSGALDRATATLLDRELNARAPAMTRLLVDLTGLEFVDAGGMDSLVRVHRRAYEQRGKLSFRRGPHVAQWPLGLIRIVQLRSEWATRPTDGSDEDSYFALAMACADVDHPRPGDRPGAA